MSIRYFETVEELERKVAAGTATYTEKQMAERLGVPVPQMAYKDRGSTYRSFKAEDVDTGKLTRLIGSLKGMGIDLTGFVNADTPEQQMDGLVQAISDWLQPGQGAAQGQPVTGGAGASDRFAGAKDGAGASATIRPSGGPKAMAAPPRNQAAQKEVSDQAWNESLKQLSSVPPYFNQPAQPAQSQPVQQKTKTEAQEYTDIASALLKPPPYYDRSRR